jgi:hypothetical protein
MTWQNNPAFTFAQAVALGHDVYEVMVTDWGLQLPGAPAPSAFVNTLWPPPTNNLVQPGLANSLAAVAIGPRSTIDRCLVTYNLQGPKTVVVPAQDRARRLAVGSPLLFTQAANPEARANPVLNVADNQTIAQALYVWSGQTKTISVGTAATLNDVEGLLVDEKIQYVAADGSGLKDLFPVSIVAPNQERPTLHLLLYPKLPALYPPSTRTPMVRKGSTLITGAGEVRLATLPVFGRKHIDVQLSCAVNNTTFRIGALRALTNVAAANIEVQEVSVLVVAGTPVNYRFSDLGADYLIIYADPAAEPTTAQWAMIATDR